MDAKAKIVHLPQYGTVAGLALYFGITQFGVLDPSPSTRSSFDPWSYFLYLKEIWPKIYIYFLKSPRDSYWQFYTFLQYQNGSGISASGEPPT